MEMKLMLMELRLNNRRVEFFVIRLPPLRHCRIADRGRHLCGALSTFDMIDITSRHLTLLTA